MVGRGLLEADHEGAQIRQAQPVGHHAAQHAALLEEAAVAAAPPLPVMTSTSAWPGALRRCRKPQQRPMRLVLAHAVQVDRRASTRRAPRRSAAQGLALQRRQRRQRRRRPVVAARSAGGRGRLAARRRAGWRLGLRLGRQHAPVHAASTCPRDMGPEPSLLGRERAAAPAHRRSWLRLQDHEADRVAHQAGPGAGRGAAADEEIAARRADDGGAGILRDRQPRAAARVPSSRAAASPSIQNGRP